MTSTESSIEPDDRETGNQAYDLWWLSLSDKEKKIVGSRYGASKAFQAGYRECKKDVADSLQCGKIMGGFPIAREFLAGAII